ncbi:MAG: redox-sensing transcriptional repressor Rex, partial [Actinomycetota bacterium]
MGVVRTVMTAVTDDHRLSTGLRDENSSSVVVTRSVFGMAERPRRRIPDATVARLPIYLRILHDLVEKETTGISSEQLAELAAVNAAKVRKDLSYLGSYGT